MFFYRTLLKILKILINIKRLNFLFISKKSLKITVVGRLNSAYWLLLLPNGAPDSENSLLESQGATNNENVIYYYILYIYVTPCDSKTIIMYQEAWLGKKKSIGWIKASDSGKKYPKNWRKWKKVLTDIEKNF